MLLVEKNEVNYVALADDESSYFSIIRAVEPGKLKVVKKDLQTDEILENVAEITVESRPHKLSSNYEYVFYPSGIVNGIEKPAMIAKSKNDVALFDVSRALEDKNKEGKYTFYEFSSNNEWLMIGFNGNLYKLEISNLSSKVPSALEYLKD